MSISMPATPATDSPSNKIDNMHRRETDSEMMAEKQTGI
jgi:hypothetical protein